MGAILEYIKVILLQDMFDGSILVFKNAPRFWPSAPQSQASTESDLVR